MNCIFCKRDSSTSCSVEHIIPESLGGWKFTLPVGVVCDACNNYFARKVEKPLLDTSYFRNMRCHLRLWTKRGNPPSEVGIHLESLTPVNWYPDMDGDGASICATYPKDETRFIRSLMARSHGNLIVPMPIKPNSNLMSRYIGKVALELLEFQLINSPQWLHEITEKEELDPLRNFVRRGGRSMFWQYCERHLYNPEHIFYEKRYGYFEMLNEWTFLYTESLELYLIIVIFGIEYAINLGDENIEGYRKWLLEHNELSPLYPRGLDLNRLQ